MLLKKYWDICCHNCANLFYLFFVLTELFNEFAFTDKYTTTKLVLNIGNSIQLLSANNNLILETLHPKSVRQDHLPQDAGKSL